MLRLDTKVTAPVTSKCHQFLLIVLVLVQPLSLHSRSVLAFTFIRLEQRHSLIFDEFHSFKKTLLNYLIDGLTI